MDEEEEDIDMDLIREKENKTTGFRIYGGLGITGEGNKSESESQSRLSYFLGIGYERLVLDNLSLEARLLFSQRNAFNMKSSEVHIEYNFGYTREEKLVEYQSLFYAELPIIFSYFIHTKHQVGIGIQYSRILTSKYDLSESVESTGNPRNVSTETVYGLTNEINKNEIDLIFSYRYNFAPKWSCGLMFQYALNPALQESFTNENQSYFNHQARIQVAYKIFE